jgi:hypothetical protein
MPQITVRKCDQVTFETHLLGTTFNCPNSRIIKMLTLFDRGNRVFVKVALRLHLANEIFLNKLSCVLASMAIDNSKSSILGYIIQVFFSDELYKRK